jgi:predicted phosphodiesterase
VIHIIATADNHLGRHYARMSVAALEKRRTFLRRGFLAACRYALEKQADVFVIAGDLFDQTAPRNIDRTTVARWLYKLREAGIHVFAVAGNHDSPRSQTEEGGVPAIEVYQAAGLLNYFAELGNSESPPQVLKIREHTLAIGGFSPNFALHPGEDPLAHLQAGLPPADLRLLLSHFLIEGWVHPDAAEGEPIVRRAGLEALRDVHLVIAGDIHEHHQTRLGGVHVVVPGATERMDFGAREAHSPGFANIRWEASGQIQVKHIAIEPQPRLLVDLGAPDLGMTDPTGGVAAAIEQALADVGGDALVLVKLAGTVEPEIYQALNLIEIAERFRDRVCHLDIEASALRPRRAQGLAGPRGPSRTLSEEIRIAAREIAGGLSEEDHAALDEVTAQILAVLSIEAKG